MRRPAPLGRSTLGVCTILFELKGSERRLTIRDLSKTPSQVVGLDLGDRYGYAAILEQDREDVVEEFRVPLSDKGLRQAFAQRCACLIAIEVGSHSRWVSRLLSDLGHRVLVANARKVHLISKNRRKDDRIDAKILARLARADTELLSPVTHRAESHHLDLAVIRARDVLVRSRTKLINHCRGQVKTTGQRLPTCDARSFARKISTRLPEPLRPALEPLLEQIAAVTAQISSLDQRIQEIARTRYPETELLTQVQGVGSLTALTYVLILENPRRFRDGRQVAAYLGLVPGRYDSGETKRGGRITKEGDKMLRRLLVQSAHYILGPFGPECELRLYGQQLVQRGGRYAKKKARVAVARKLAGILYQLWLHGEVYDPWHHTPREQQRAA